MEFAHRLWRRYHRIEKYFRFDKVSKLDTKKTPRGGGTVLDNFTTSRYTKHRKGAAGKRLAPTLDYEVTAGCGTGRLLLFIDRNKEADNAND